MAKKKEALAQDTAGHREAKTSKETAQHERLAGDSNGRSEASPKKEEGRSKAKAGAGGAPTKPQQAGTKKSEAPPKILFLASECVPFVKTGGLADVVGALPKALAALGADVRVMLPKYRAIPEEYRSRMQKIAQFRVQLGWRDQSCAVEGLALGGIQYYFVENEYYFGRDNIYGDFSTDEGERFGYFCKAALESLVHIGFVPDALHCHDWQTGMAVALLKLQYCARPEYAGIKTVFTIHNLRYQGVFDWCFMDELLSLGKGCYTPEGLEYFGGVNFLKAGVVYADAVTTVSPTYAREILTPEYGETLEGVLQGRKNSLYGILNGLDETLYDPETDPALASAEHYTAEKPAGKAACKAALQAELGLAQDGGAPLFGMVSRLTGQKGFDLVQQALVGLMERKIQLAVLGSGDAALEDFFRWAAMQYPGRVAARFELNAALANRVYAGSDFFLMPSRFEPCGLSQMIALRYGAVPVVRETGGLCDSVQPYNKFTGEGVGFSFLRCDAADLIGATDRALEVYHKPEAMAALRKNGMHAHFGWEKSARAYLALYVRA